MAKIRGIKPEFWTDEDICELSPLARLLFIGMWNWACDNGHLQDKPKQIKRRILPDDDVSAADLLREIEAQELIARDDAWITVTNLGRHQRIDARYFTTCEKEGCIDPPEKVSQRKTRRAPAEHTSSARRTPAGDTSSAHVDGDGDGDGDGDNSYASVDAPDRFEEFWNTYDKKRDRKKAEAKYRLALKKRGVTADTLIAAAAAYIDFQKRDGKHPEYTKDPVTWLNNESWGNELTVRRAAKDSADIEDLHDWMQPGYTKGQYA